MKVDDMTPEQKAEAIERQKKRRARYAELNKVRKTELCRMLRAGGLVWSLHPPEKWRKDEVIHSIIDQEERRAETPSTTDPKENTQ